MKKNCFYAKQAIDNKAIVLPVGGEGEAASTFYIK